MRPRWLALSLLPFAAAAAPAEPPCSAAPPLASLSIPHRQGDPALSLDPAAEEWKNAARAWMVKDCSRVLEYPDLRTEVRAFWTDTGLYLLFLCPYKELNVFLPAEPGKPRVNLWDRDVVEVFLGDDWNHIRRYREFEIAPTGDWIDLAIDLDRKGGDYSWRSGWKTAARIDRGARVWYAAARIPLASVGAAKVTAGTRWRMNLYRIDGVGPDSQRHFLCWQPTCVQNRDPNHVPEHFGTLVFEK